jgi:hypothetical protein
MAGLAVKKYVPTAGEGADGCGRVTSFCVRRNANGYKNTSSRWRWPCVGGTHIHWRVIVFLNEISNLHWRGANSTSCRSAGSKYQAAAAARTSTPPWGREALPPRSHALIEAKDTKRWTPAATSWLMLAPASRMFSFHNIQTRWRREKKLPRTRLSLQLHGHILLGTSPRACK